MSAFRDLDGKMHEVKFRRVCYAHDYTALLDVGYDVLILHILLPLARKNELAFEHQLEYSNVVLFYYKKAQRACLSLSWLLRYVSLVELTHQSHNWGGIRHPAEKAS